MSKRKRTPSEFLSSRREYAPVNQARLEVLYSDFTPSKQSNPTGYKANVETWQGILVDATREAILSDDTLILHDGQSLRSNLTWPRAGRPLSLSAVIATLKNTRTLITYDEFITSQKSVIGRSWLKDSVLWALQRLNVIDDTPPLDDGKVETDLVVVPNVESAARSVLSRQESNASSYSDKVWNTQTFEREFVDCVDPPLSSKDLKLLIRYLERDIGELQTAPGVVKFSKEPVTETDRSVLNVKTTLADVSNRVKALEKRVEELDQTARESIAASPPRKTQAKNAIALKQHLNAQVLPPLHASERNLSELLFKIDSSASEVEVLKALQDGSAALKNVMEEGRKITGKESYVEGVEGVMDTVRETLDEYNEGEGEWRDQLEGVAPMDQYELDAELKALEEEARPISSETVEEEAGPVRSETVGEKVEEPVTETPEKISAQEVLKLEPDKPFTADKPDSSRTQRPEPLHA